MVRLRNKFEVKNIVKGPPRIVRMPAMRKDDPDNYPSLLRYLQATGKVQHITQATLMKARNLYLQGINSGEIAKQLFTKVEIVDRWALIFSWDEERDRRLFDQFRTIAGTDQIYGKNIAQRHDRVAGSIEQVAERLLQKHTNGEITLSTQDLGRLAATIKATQEIRRTSRNEDVRRTEERKDINVNISIPHAAERIASALVSATSRPRLAITATKTIAVGNEDVIGSDTNLETSDGK